MASQRESRANKSKLENDNGMADLRSFELDLPEETSYYKNMTYRATLATEEQAKELCAQLIHGGVYQQQENGWVVWQLDQP